MLLRLFQTSLRSAVIAGSLAVASLPAVAQLAEDAGEEIASAPKLAADLSETIARVPVTVGDLSGRKHAGDMIVTHFRPPGPGPFPLAVINHGRAATTEERTKQPRMRFVGVVRYWVGRGFAVVVPTRLGYGEAVVSGDPEYGGRCKERHDDHVAEAAGRQVIAAIDFARTLPFVDPARIVVTGTSVGGLATTWANGRNPPGVIAAINFSGGTGGRPKETPGEPCDGAGLVRVFAGMAKTAKAPMLWIYATNDEFWGEAWPRQWHAAYVGGGAGKAEFASLPPLPKSGHKVMTGAPKLWHPIVDDFLARHGLGKAR